MGAGVKPLERSDPVRLGSITLRGRLGSGGMGRVYYGLTDDYEPVALKVIREDLAGRAEVRARFARETDALRTVQSPQVAALIDASDEDADQPWLAVEYVRGLNLKEYIDSRGPLDPQQAATLGALLAGGLGDIHRAGLLHRDFKPGNVLLGRGAVFGTVAIGGAAIGAKAASHVSGEVLLAAFAGLLLLIGSLMAWRQVRHGRRGDPTAVRPRLDDPILTFSPTFACNCPRALKLLLTATAVGLLTGFLGVGGGFLVVPALVLALGLPMQYAAGTSLVAITITSAAALLVRAGTDAHPDWGFVLVLTAASGVAAAFGALVADRMDTARLQGAFTSLVLVVALYTAARALPALF